MCKEYIEREAAIAAIRNLYPGIPLVKVNLEKWHEQNRDFMACETAIEHIHAADVRPVVLCKDCQYCHADRAGNIGCFHYSHYQTSWGGKIKPEDYCSLGRKREA